MEHKLAKGMVMKQKRIQLGINEIVQVSCGTLLNRPSISFFEQICDDVNAVKKGDLFVLTQENAQEVITLAIQKGAFGILFSGNIAMGDEEVAWISVQDLQSSLMRLLRHYLLIHNKILLALEKDAYEIATQVITPNKNLSIFSGSLTGLIAHLLGRENAYTLYYDTTQKAQFLEKQQEIQILSKERLGDEKLPFIVESYSLFGIKIFYQDADYFLPLPKLFIQTLARVIEFCLEHSLKVNLENFIGISSFKPVFLDERGFISKPGATNKVFLATENIELYERYLAYFTMHAKWAYLNLFVPKQYQEIYAPYAKVVPFSTNDEIFESLVYQKYNFALVLGINTQVLEEHFTKIEDENNLFNYTNLE